MREGIMTNPRPAQVAEGGARVDLRDRESYTLHVYDMDNHGRWNAAAIPGCVRDVAEAVMDENHPEGWRIVSRVTPIDDRSWPVELICEGVVTLDGVEHTWRHIFLRPSEPWLKSERDPTPTHRPARATTPQEGHQ